MAIRLEKNIELFILLQRSLFLINDKEEKNLPKTKAKSHEEEEYTNSY